MKKLLLRLLRLLGYKLFIVQIQNDLDKTIETKKIVARNSFNAMHQAASAYPGVTVENYTFIVNDGE